MSLFQKKKKKAETKANAVLDSGPSQHSLESDRIPQLDYRKIAECAYYIWERKGKAPGQDLDNWLQAEAYLRNPKPSSDVYDVILLGSGEQEIQVIRLIREVTGFDLKLVQDLVNATPHPIRKVLPKKEAEAIMLAIEKAGGQVEIRPSTPMS